jgi:hypothetical protein
VNSEIVQGAGYKQHGIETGKHRDKVKYGVIKGKNSVSQRSQRSQRETRKRSVFSGLESYGTKPEDRH